MTLVDCLQDVPSNKFYKTFADLRSTIQYFKVKWKLDQNTPPQVMESDEASNAVDQESEIDHGRTEPIEVAELQSTDLAVSEKSQEMLQQPPGSSPEKTKEGALSKTESTITREAAVNNVEVLRLPASLGSHSKKAEMVIAECGSDCPVYLEDFLSGLKLLLTSGTIASKYPACFKKRFLLSRSPTVLQKRASEVLAETNFFIPVKLLERVNRALLSWISQQAEFEDVDPSHDDVVPAAFVASEMGGFSMTYVRWLLQHYALMAIVDEYRMDLAWLQGNWSEFTTMKHKFLEKTPASPTGLAKEVAQLLLHGHLPRLQGLPVAVLLRHFVKYLRYRRENNRTDYPLASCNYVLVSIHMVALKHWIIQIVEVQMGDQDTSKHKIWVTFYDPLGVASNPDVCQAKWISLTLPLLQQWFDRDAGEIRWSTRRKFYPRESKNDTATVSNADPAPQPQSCSLPEVVAVPIAYSYMYVTRDRSLKTSNSNSQKDMAQMRLRLLWTMLHKSTAADENRDVEVWILHLGQLTLETLEL
ncbi:hypothetical protein GQ600_22819 [Phytophthora cactorum]|nr:hypothetical protein GQ600_22819 [Phytophthora cactorum]